MQPGPSFLHNLCFTPNGWNMNLRTTIDFHPPAGIGQFLIPLSGFPLIAPGLRLKHSVPAGRKRRSGELDGAERASNRDSSFFGLAKTDLPCFVRDLRRRPRNLKPYRNGPEAVVVAGTPSMDVVSNLAGPDVATGFRDVVRHGNRGVFLCSTRAHSPPHSSPSILDFLLRPCTIAFSYATSRARPKVHFSSSTPYYNEIPCHQTPPNPADAGSAGGLGAGSIHFHHQ